jgi:membrane-bound lytic murein transglycosylase D
MHKGFLVFRMRKFIGYLGMVLFVLLFLTSNVFALSLSQKYPSYQYVFHEFDVDDSYLDDAEFISFISKYESRMKRFYKRSLLRGKVILPTMQGLLANDGVSDLFIYLSMVESGFSNTAVSPKKAVGLWQFMPATAKHYNLTVCNSYDERCDTVSSTSAAIAYLNKLHKQFGKWYLAVLAYNCGEGCLQRAITKAGSKDLSLLTDEGSKYLPKETRDYIRKILLISMIGENSNLDVGRSTNNTLDGVIEVEVAKGTLLKHIATLLKLDVELLLKLNRKIKNGIVPKEKERYKIIIPIEKVFAFYLRYEIPQTTKKIKPHLISHYVALGETLESIAERYHTTIEEIIRANHLTDDYLTLEQFLVIPVSKKIFENTLVGHK